VSTLAAGVRKGAGHPSGPQIAADTGMAIDTSPATCTGHQPSGRRSFRNQRTVNPLIAPARYNFLYSASRPACGRPPAAAVLGRHDPLGTDRRIPRGWGLHGWAFSTPSRILQAAGWHGAWQGQSG
jgi:hypothetical protein